MSITYPAPPIHHHSDREHRRIIALVVGRILDGKINSTGTVTLTASATSTTLNDARISPNSKIFFQGTTQNAAGEIGMYVSSKGNGTATITHASSALSDRTFDYLVIG